MGERKVSLQDLAEGFVRYEKRLLSFVLRRFTSRPEVAEDIVTTAKKKLVERAHKVDLRPDNLVALIFRAVRHAAIDAARQAARRQEVLATDMAVDDDDDDRFARSIDANLGALAHRHAERQLTIRRELERALNSLPARQREAFVLRYRDGYSRQEVAALMKIGEQSVKTHTAEAQRKLAAMPELRELVGRA